MCESTAFQGLIEPPDDATGLARAVGHTADPDEALLGLVRLLEAADGEGHLGRDAHQPDRLRELLSAHSPQRDRLLSVLGASRALADHLTAHPGHWVAAAEPAPLTAAQRADALVAAVSPHQRGQRSAYDALRIAYREQMLGIAAQDLIAVDPRDSMPATAAALADLAAAALEAALSIAGQEHPQAAAQTRLAVIGMGKCGGGELNYVSDVDVIFVAEPAEGVTEDDAVLAATTLASTLMKACSAATGEGTLWPVDAALRPEGKQGPLVRTVASHRQYYQRWAKTWEFQALLKARVVAGDREVGQAYLEAVTPMVWTAASRDNFVPDVQAMRRRVEAHVPAAEAKRQLKLGPGGLRDIEFSVQLLQLVHGRADESLRSGTTLEALAALADGGYVARDDAAELDTSYRFLRSLEHRIQLHRMRRTHVMPTAETDLRRLGRSMGLREEPSKGVVAEWQNHAREVRRIHERLFYRPLLNAAARLSTDEARLTPAAAQDRLAALGFRDPAGAMRHIEALTSGYTRTAAIQRTLLPVMLGWFADEAAPDAGLLAFRQVSDSLGGTHWYLKMLRDEGRAAERLAHVLGRSRYAADLLERAPESVRILGEVEGLTPRTRVRLLATMRSAARRKDDPQEAMLAARVIRRQELFRIVLADLVGVVDHHAVGVALTDLTEALLQTALDVAIRKVEIERRGPLPTDIAVIGMGRLGGQECGYFSDADVMWVHRPHLGPSADQRGAAGKSANRDADRDGDGDAGGDNEADTDADTSEALAADAGAAALAVAQEMRRLVGLPGPDPQLDLDPDLRPDGKSGLLVRDLAGYEAYYRERSAIWEAQALLRARPIAGDTQLGEDFTALIDPIRYPAAGLSASDIKEIRRLKARMEAERLPRGADPKTQVKLGRGGLSDVEWTIQLIQLQRGHEVDSLRTTQTLAAIDAAVRAELMATADAEQLAAAWNLASSIRNAVILWRGRGSDSVPADVQDAEGVWRILGGEAGSGADLADQYRRTARHARSVTDRLFFGRRDS